MNSQPASSAARATRSYSSQTRALIDRVGRMPRRRNRSKKRQTPTRIQYSCHAQLGTSGNNTWPVGAGSTCRAIGREIDQYSRLTMVHTTSRARPGNLSGGRSTIAEKVLRLRGIMPAPGGGLTKVSQSRAARFAGQAFV